ncbi:MAG: hypothetical protein FWC75_02720 [Oscillospiraceae bacterium]|nr:hypothetical protein [Oscillospiraceae bacterium]
MNTLKLMPALRYQLDYMVRALLIAFAVMAAIVIFISLFITTATFGDAGQVIIDIAPINFHFETSSFINVGPIFTIMIFITGIVGIREDLRFFLQHGLGRKSTYLSTLLTSLLCGATLALVFELLDLVFVNALWLRFSAVNISGLGYVGGWLLQTLVFFFAWQLGALISLLYYRMSTMVKVIFSVAIIATVVFAVPRLIGDIIDLVFSNSSDMIGGTLSTLFTNPLNIICTILALGIICTLGNFMLIRRAPVVD